MFITVKNECPITRIKERRPDEIVEKLSSMQNLNLICYLFLEMLYTKYTSKIRFFLRTNF